MNRRVVPAALSVLLTCSITLQAWSSSDWFQGSTGNLGVVTATGDQFIPAAIPDGSGGAIVAWQDFRTSASTSSDIYVQHVLSSGVVDPAWPAQGLAIRVASFADQFPVLCNDGAGGAFVAWNNSNLGGIFAHHVLSTGVADPAWTTNGTLVSPNGSTGPPKMASDGSGGAFLVWHGAGAQADQRVLAQHLTATGLAWIPTRVCTNEAGQGFPVIASDGSGGAFVAWNDLRSGTRDIYAQRIASNGTLLWSSTGVPVCVAASEQRLNGAPPSSIRITTFAEVQLNAIAPDGAGGFLATWTDERTSATTGWDIYVQRITSAGTPAAGWAAAGVAACTASGNQIAPNLLSDETGGAIVFWDDTRSGRFVQHVTGSGAVDGPSNGLVVDPLGTGTQVAVKDVAGGALLVGHRTESGYSNLYAYHLRTSPSFALDPAWPASGVAVSTATGDQFLGTAVRDNLAGVIAIWLDTRDSTTAGRDLYAQRVLTSGILPPSSTSVANPSMQVERLGIHPNPVTSSASIRFTLVMPGRVHLELYDVHGRRELDVIDDLREAGSHELRFARPGSLRAGVHYLQMTITPLTGEPGSSARRAFVLVD